MVRMTRNKLLTILIGGALLMGSALPGFAQEKTQLRVAVIPIMEHLPVVIAAEQIASPLLKVSISLDVYNSWTAVEAAFRTGAVDAAAITLPKALIMAYDNVPLKIMLVLNRNGTALVLRDDDPEKLKGKITGGSGSDTTQLLILNKFLVNKGLKIGYDVRSVLTRFHRAIFRVKEERFYGFCLPEPYGVLAEKEGIVNKVILSKDISPNHIGSVVILNPDFVAGHPGTTKEFIESIIKAAKFIENDKRHSKGRQTAMAQSDSLKMDYDVVMAALTTPIDRIVFDDLTPTEREIGEVMADVMGMGVLGGRIDLKEMIDTQYINK